MPDGSKSKTHGRMTCRSLGGLWLISESEGVSPEGQAWSSIMTVGFDTAMRKASGSSSSMGYTQESNPPKLTVLILILLLILILITFTLYPSS